MMLTELLGSLRALNVQLFVENGQLRCKAPKDTLTDTLKTQLKDRKAELIALLAKDGQGNGRITPIARTARIPLSYAQQRLWFLDQLEPGSGFYTIPMALRLNGLLHPVALSQAINEIVRRHEILRTRFVTVDGQAEQQIAASLSIPVRRVELAHLPDPTKQALAAQLCRQEADSPFDLASGPLLRVCLIGLGTTEALLLVTLHHIITDGWSATILTREFAALYQAYRNGQPSPLPELAIQYADFAYWQRQWLDGAVLQRQTDYWRQQLAGLPALLELPTDKPRPAVLVHQGANQHFSLPPALAAACYRLSRESQTTLFVTLLTAFSILLARYSNQHDLAIGTPIANRQQLATENLIGFFVNTLVLRADLSDNPTFKALLSRLNATVQAAQDHQDLPFEHLVGLLQPERHLGHSPLFQVLFSLQNRAKQPLPPLAGLTISGVESAGITAKFELSLHISQAADDGLSGLIEYNTALFDAATIARMAQHFLNLLQGIIEQPECPVMQLPLLSDGERQQLLCGFNPPRTDYPQHLCIHQRFEQQAAQTPAALALICAGQQLSYAELNRQANRLAHRLIALGIRPDDRVVLCAERSLAMVVAIIAILKAGGGYVPLDPSDPDQRLAYLLTDSQPLVILSHSALQPRLQALLPSPVPSLAMDGLATEADPNTPDTNPHIGGLTSRHLAYIMYTSGSTGQAKGVMVEHRNVINLAINGYAPITPNDCLAHCANPAFDASTWEIWAALLNGARVVLVPPAVVLEAGLLRNTLMDNGVTALWLTVGLFRQYCAELKPAFRQLTYLLIGGDVVDPGTAASLLASADRPQHLLNGYGPTETTTFASTFTVSAASPGQPIPIGRPIANSQIYILDNEMQPVPLGVAGEIHIGGAGVARGYLHRPELTAERFIANPFGLGDSAYSRLYKTGDVGKWLPDGTIAYLGRNDAQVKIRGFRIELGEIEAALCRCPGVREAAVIAREDNPGEKRLVAYLLAEPGHTLSPAELRRQLAAQLPDYSLPSVFVTLEQFPLTANGKLARKALPAPDGSSAVTQDYEAPQGDTEITVARLWQDLLQLDRVGRQDDFFALGGHSLLAVQLMSRLRQSLAVDIPVRNLFAHPALAAFSATISTERPAASNLVPIRPTGNAHPLFLIHPGKGEINYARELAQWLDADIPVYGLAASGFGVGESPLPTVEAMAACYIRAIRKVQASGPYRIAGWSAGGIIAYEIANQLLGADQTVEFVGLLDTAYYDGPERHSTDSEFLLELLAFDAPPALNSQLQSLAIGTDLDGLLDYCRNADFLPKDIDNATAKRWLAVYKAISQAVSIYCLYPPSFPVTLFAAQDNPACAAISQAWQNFIGEPLTLIPVAGNHLSMMASPHSQPLAKALSQALQKPLSQTAPESRYIPTLMIQSGLTKAPPLFCVPGAGASVTAFYALSLALDPNLPIYGLQPRGLEGCLTPHSNVAAAATAYIKAMRAITPGPYRLLGHSFGGWVAFEMAVQLIQQGADIAALILLDSEAPTPPDAPISRHNRIDMLMALAGLFELSSQQPLGLSAGDFVPLAKYAQLTLLLERLIAVKLMPPRTSLQTLCGIVRVFASNWQTPYTPEQPYLGPLHLFNVAEAGQDGNAEASSQDLRLWQQYAPHATLNLSPGNHISMLTAPHVSQLAQQLRLLLR